MNAATELKFCGYTQGRYSVLWYQFDSDRSIFYKIDFLPQNCKLDYLSRTSKGFFSTPNQYLIPQGKKPSIAFGLQVATTCKSQDELKHGVEIMIHVFEAET